jgi:hypothetical protein
MKHLTKAACLCLALAPCTFAGTRLDGNFGFAVLGYSHHAVTLAPDWDGYKDSYSGGVSLYPAAAWQSLTNEYYWKIDVEGLTAALGGWAGFGGAIAGDDIGTLINGTSPSYLKAYHASIIPRDEFGWMFFSALGGFGFGGNLDVANLGLTTGKRDTDLDPGSTLDVGPQFQYFAILPGRLVVNPSVTVNVSFIKGGKLVDGWGMGFGTMAAWNIFSFLALHGEMEYDIHNLKMDSPSGGSGEKAQFRDFTVRLGLAYGGSR